MLATPLGRLRAIGWVEGASFLLLLGVAMPLKYFAGVPIAVKIVGWAHGLLFIGYCIALVDTARTMKWTFGRMALAFIAALVPFGTFALDRSLAREDEGRAAAAGSRSA